MQAKWFKIMNHMVFPNGRLHWKFAFNSWELLKNRQYDYAIWCDGSLRIKSNSFAQEIVKILRHYPIAIFTHPERDCIFDEAIASTPMKKYENLPMNEQVQHYSFLGTPAHCGLFACGVIGRRLPNETEQILFNNEWWEENKKWTYQDQLSFAHLVYQKKISIGCIEGYLWNNKYFDWKGHKSDY